MFLKIQTIKKELSLLIFNMKKALGVFLQASFSQNHRKLGLVGTVGDHPAQVCSTPPCQLDKLVKPNKAKLQASWEWFRESKPQPEALQAQYKAYGLFLLQILQYYRAHGYKIHADCTQSPPPSSLGNGFQEYLLHYLPRLTSLYFPGFSSLPCLKIEKTFSLFICLGTFPGHHDLSEIIESVTEL